MSFIRTAHGVDVVVSTANTQGSRWVRRQSGPLRGRSLGTVRRAGSAWQWDPTPLAFLGDGRPGCERDGDRTIRVPADLLAGGRARGQDAAIRALVAWLIEHEAPVMGYGPHSAVIVKEVA